MFFIRLSESGSAEAKIWSINWIMLIKSFADSSRFYYFSTKYFSCFWYCTLLKIRFTIIWYALINKFSSYIVINPPFKSYLYSFLRIEPVKKKGGDDYLLLIKNLKPIYFLRINTIYKSKIWFCNFLSYQIFNKYYKFTTLIIYNFNVKIK